MVSNIKSKRNLLFIIFLTFVGALNAQEKISEFEFKVAKTKEIIAIKNLSGVPYFLIRYGQNLLYGLTLDNEWKPARGVLLTKPGGRHFDDYLEGVKGYAEMEIVYSILLILRKENSDVRCLT